MQMKGSSSIFIWTCTVATLSFLDVDDILGYYNRTLQGNEDATGVIDTLTQKVVSGAAVRRKSLKEQL
jgi:hypothetical protein